MNNYTKQAHNYIKCTLKDVVLQTSVYKQPTKPILAINQPLPVAKSAYEQYAIKAYQSN